MPEHAKEGNLIMVNHKVADNDIIRINVHKSLLEEFKVRKEQYEKKLGYVINGGTPIISQICAKMLENERLGKKDKIIIEVHKIKGLKRIDTIFL